MTVGILERRRVLDELSRLATGDVVRVWRAAEGAGSVQFREIITQAFPDVIDPYAATAADFAAEWYDASAPELTFRARPGPLPDREALSASAQWALGASGDDALGRLAGTLQRAIWNTSRETLIGNVKAERGALWARSVSADACAFCAMLATRGAVYLSADTASFKSHDYCRCQTTEIRPGKNWEPASYVERYEDAYIKASRRATGTKAVLAEMRQILGAR